MEIIRNFYQTATVLFVLAFTYTQNGVMGQCVQNPINIAVKEGTQNLLMQCAPNPTPVNWICYPTSDELDNAKINDETGVVPEALKNLYKLGPQGLTILTATIYEGSNPYSTAGICLGLHGNETRLVGAKLIVVHDGPVCTLNVSAPANGAPVLLNCTMSYADHSVHPVRPNLQIKLGDSIIFHETVLGERINQYIFVAWKSIEMAYNACAPITITLTFDPPTDIQYEFIATNKPDFTNTVVIPASSDGCLRNGANIAVLEGSQNVLIGSSRTPQTLQRSVSPTSDQLSTFPISDYEKGILPNMTQYYSQDKTGLTILTATAVAVSNQLATAGIYTEKDRSGKLQGFKVIVVRGPPTCSSTVDKSNPPKTGDSIQLTCVLQYADHALHQIPSRMTLKRGSTPRNVATPQKTIKDDGTFTATAVFSVAYDPNSVDTCVASFDPPPSDPGYAYVASNAPSFTSSCTF